jgi:hypothetical protein
MPLTWRRVILIGAALAGFAILFPVATIRRFYELELPHSQLTATLLIAAAGVLALIAFWVLSHRTSDAAPG